MAKTNLIYKITFLLLFMLSKAGAQDKGMIVISGRIDSSITKQYASNELIVRIKETTNFLSQGPIIKTNIGPKGDFNLRIKNNSRIYLSFELLNLGNNTYAKGEYFDLSFPKNRPLKEVYLFENGDSLFMDISKEGEILFKGKGSDKLNCQWQMYNIEVSPRSVIHRSIQLSNAIQHEKRLEFERKTANLALKLKLEILDSYKTQLSDPIYKLLYIDAVAACEYKIFQFLRLICFEKPQELNQKIAQNYYIANEASNILNIDTALLVESAYYADLLFQKEYSYAQIHSRKGNYHTGDSFKEVYERIKNRYTGPLRDKMLFICFERLNKIFGEEAKSLIDETILAMQNNRYKNLLMEFRNQKYQAYPFELQDTAGKVHKLKDYRGKLIVIDFWYTGCGWCIKLNSAMHDIVEKYKNNNDIAFLTVCVDQKKESWLNSIATGKYTSTATIDLFTNGMGRSHPLIQNYGFKGYPSQLIIGKNGELVTSGPPRVDGGEEKKIAFMKIIDDYLK